MVIVTVMIIVIKTRIKRNNYNDKIQNIDDNDDQLHSSTVKKKKYLKRNRILKRIIMITNTATTMITMRITSIIKIMAKTNPRSNGNQEWK